MASLIRAIYEGTDGRGSRAEIFFWIQRGTLGLVILMVLSVGVVQPSMIGRAIFSAASVATIWLVSHLLARRGEVRAASWVLVLGLVLLVAVSAFAANGIESPGVRSYLVFVLMAGVLLGERAALGVAVLCASIALGLALAGEAGLLPRADSYRPLSLWILLCAYLLVTVFVMRLFARAVTSALDRTQESLREKASALAKLDTVLRVGAIGIWSWDPHTRMYRGDAALHEMLGSALGPHDVVPEEAWLNLVHPDDVEMVRRHRDAATEGASQTSVNIRLRDQRGELRELEITFMPDPESTGPLRSATGLVLDRTEARRAVRERLIAATELQERVKELRLLHDATGVLRPDRAYSPEVLRDLVDRIPAAFVKPEITSARVSYGSDSAESQGFARSDLEISVPVVTSVSRGEIVVALRAAPSLGQNAFLAEEQRLLVTLADMLNSYLERDAAERRREALERQMRQTGKLEALGTLAGGVAHDFNNILTAIGTNAAVAQASSEPDSTTAQALAEIDRAHARARDLVRRILLFSKQVPGERRPVDLSEIVLDVKTLVRSSLPPTVTLETSIPVNLPPLVADPTQVHQAVLNLVTNAAHAMRASGVGRVTVRAQQFYATESSTVLGTLLAPGDYVRLDVEDNGPGIAPELLERVFDPFFTTKGAEGTGLGLAVVHGVMQEHGGGVTLQSDLGRGTTFSLYFPADRSQTQVSETAARPVHGRGERVLFVDDEESIAFAMSKLLPSIGYVCEAFSDPLTALQAFRTDSGRYDIAILDMSMPGMQGDALAKELTRLRPHFPVVICSGYSGEMIPVGPEFGVAAAIPKPVELPSLSRVMAKHLQRH